MIKNPFHSFRIKELNEIFPDARYIHIIRHPHKVVPSTIRMWDIVGTQNAMNRKWNKPGVEDTSELLLRMLNQIERDVKNIPDNRYYELKFEDLEKNPVKEIKRIYEHLNVQFSTEYEQQIQDFLVSLEGYKKNKYDLHEGDKLKINNILKSWMSEKAYSLD